MTCNGSHLTPLYLLRSFSRLRNNELHAVGNNQTTPGPRHRGKPGMLAQKVRTLEVRVNCIAVLHVVFAGREFDPPSSLKRRLNIDVGSQVERDPIEWVQDELVDRSSDEKSRLPLRGFVMRRCKSQASDVGVCQ